MSVQSGVDQVAAVLERVPWTLWVMTSSHDGQRAGSLVRWVQRCSDEPVLMSVSMKKCHSLEPLIRDSRGFALNLVSETDRLLHRTFDGHRAPDEVSDVFDSLAVDTWRTGSPVLRRALAALDCEVVRHLDLESDCELFIGQVVEARVLNVE
ncbi:MAG: flavin reductase family protein [Planctomycetota bacterium]